ncbi:hypothetical protein [Actinomycetospora sp. NBRC 106378]|uniref:PIN-like domain-containing protein n=1 Tax=Actinomycetospora sp. NBRC 106378 TaxID=3032208 RepID=UPI0024A4978C|nr:hypothetical protein [Actinomycetospora sp. NBRC 106378]GLZ55525.1 putative ribonuclease VapC45 [Actinomycetospora sp. NBRC 106378]
MARSGRAPGLPWLFLDRSLGGRQVPDRLRREGLPVITLADVYGVPADQDVADTTWLARAGAEGWIVLMKDERIRYRAVETTALRRYGVRAFCLANGNLRAQAMADLFLSVMDDIVDLSTRPGPFLYVVSTRGLRAVDLGEGPD